MFQVSEVADGYSSKKLNAFTVPLVSAVIELIHYIYPKWPFWATFSIEIYWKGFKFVTIQWFRKWMSSIKTRLSIPIKNFKSGENETRKFEIKISYRLKVRIFVRIFRRNSLQTSTDLNLSCMANNECQINNIVKTRTQGTARSKYSRGN